MKRQINTANRSALVAAGISLAFLVMAVVESGAERAIYISAAVIIWVLSLILAEFGKWGRL